MLALPFAAWATLSNFSVLSPLLENVTINKTYIAGPWREWEKPTQGTQHSTSLVKKSKEPNQTKRHTSRPALGDPVAGAMSPKALPRMTAKKLCLLPAMAGPSPASRPSYVRATQVGSWVPCHVGQRYLGPHLNCSPKAGWGGSPLMPNPTASSPGTRGTHSLWLPYSACFSWGSRRDAEP